MIGSKELLKKAELLKKHEVQNYTSESAPKYVIIA